MLPRPRHDLDGALARLDELGAFPEAALRVVRVAREKDATLSRMVAAVEADPGLSGHLLHLANTPLFGLPRKVASLDRAIQLLGFGPTRDVALAFALSAMGRRASLQGRVAWEHAVRLGVASRLLAPALALDPGRAFACGLLCDVGRLLLLVLEPEAYEPLLERMSYDVVVAIQAERFHFGFDHARLGAAALRRWGLPPATCAAVERHHDLPEDGQELDPLHALVVVAEELVRGAERGRSAADLADDLLAVPPAAELGLDEVRCGALVDSLQRGAAALLAGP